MNNQHELLCRQLKPRASTDQGWQRVPTLFCSKHVGHFVKMGRSAVDDVISSDLCRMNVSQCRDWRILVNVKEQMEHQKHIKTFDSTGVPWGSASKLCIPTPGKLRQLLEVRTWTRAVRRRHVTGQHGPVLLFGTLR